MLNENTIMKRTDNGEGQVNCGSKRDGTVFARGKSPKAERTIKHPLSGLELHLLAWKYRKKPYSLHSRGRHVHRAGVSLKIIHGK